MSLTLIHVPHLHLLLAPKVLFKVRMRLGHFDPVGPLQQFPLSDVCSDYAIELSQNGR